MDDPAFEIVVRDVAVATTDSSYKASTLARLGPRLQRLFEPVMDEEPDRFGQLLTALERCVADGPK